MTMSSSLSTSFICPEVEPRAPRNTMASMAVSSNGDSTKLLEAIWPLPVMAVHILNDSSLHRSENRRTSSPRNATLASKPILSCGAGCSSTVDGDALLANGLYALDDGPGDLTADEKVGVVIVEFVMEAAVALAIIGMVPFWTLGIAVVVVVAGVVVVVDVVVDVIVVGLVVTVIGINVVTTGSSVEAITASVVTM